MYNPTADTGIRIWIIALIFAIVLVAVFVLWSQGPSIAGM